MEPVLINSSVNGKRRSKKAASDAELKILADFESKVKEKELKKQQREREEKARAMEREKKKREMEAFQQEIDKMLNDEEDDDPRQKEVTKSYVAKNIGSVKNRWGQIEEQRKKTEEEKAMKERREREAKDNADKKKIAKDLMMREMEEMEASGSSRRKSNVSEVKPKKLDMSKQNFLERAKQEEAEKIAEERRRRAEEDRKLRENRELHLQHEDEDEPENTQAQKVIRKPSKINVTAEELAAKQEAARQKKLEMERAKRLEEDRIRMEAERENYVSDEEEEVTTQKKEITVNKLKINLKDLEAKRDQAALERAQTERRKRQKEDELRMLAERETYESDEEVEFSATKEEISIGKININYEAIIANKTAQEKESLSSGMKDKMDDFRKLRQMSKTYAEEDFKEREQMARTLMSSSEHTLEIGKIDATKRNLDSEFAQRDKEMAEKLALEKVEQLRAEIRLMNEAKRQLMQQEMADIVDQERTESEDREINKLDTKFTNFDKLSDEKVALDAIKLRNERKKQLEREMLQFEEEKEQFEDDFEEMKTEVIQRNVGKLDNSKTKFDSLEQQREQERLQQLKLNRMEQLRAELRRMESERQTWDDPSDIDKDLISETSEKVIPNKLKNNFEEIQRQKQQVLEQEIRLAKMQAMENELVQLQEAWNEENSEEDDEPLVRPVEKTVMNPGRLDKEQLQFDKAHLYDKDVNSNRPVKVKKMNANKYFEQMQKQKEAEERERLEEQRLARAQKERDEMIEAKKRELNQQLAELEDDGTGSEQSFEDEDMDGSPSFLEPLVNCTMKEGSKFRIACSIAGFPQPKVIWYHNKVPLKNGEDYQYKINGTIYSLCMDECFREDEGIYTIRAVNDKGIDMSECQVKVVA